MGIGENIGEGVGENTGSSGSNPVVGPPVDFTPNQLDINFEGYTLGTNGEQAGLFDYNADATLVASYSAESVLALSGTQLGRCITHQGHNGNNTSPHFGGEVGYANKALEGETLWTRVYYYVPSDFDFTCGDASVKFIRLTTSNGTNRHDLKVVGNGTALYYGFERDSGTNFTIPYNFPRDQWVSLEIAVKCSVNASGSEVWIWADGVLLLNVDDTTVYPSDQGYPLLTVGTLTPGAVAPGIHTLLIISNWNGGGINGRRLLRITGNSENNFTVGNTIVGQTSGTIGEIYQIDSGSSRFYVGTSPGGGAIPITGWEDFTVGETLVETESAESCVFSYTYPANDQSVYIDALSACTNTPPNLDSFGNPMIGSWLP